MLLGNTLQDEQKIILLTKLEEKDSSFETAVVESKEMKELNATKEQFLNHVDMKSWDEAEKEIPQYANEEKLKIFSSKSARSQQQFMVS